MVANSLIFLLFFVVVFIIYFIPNFRKSPKFQNIWLFITSYYFYGYTDWKMLPLLLGATTVFYGIGLWLKAEMIKGDKKKASNITTFGVILGVCVLLYFKYLNFFAESFVSFLNAIGLYISWTTLNIILPIGVSFFTFKLISYIIEIHREHIQPCTDFIEFGTYIAFFPTILSGPIDRPNKFIPQLGETRLFNYDLAVDGCRQILWGIFTKMCIADNLATFTDFVWLGYASQSGSTLLLTALLYPIQIYADFDGYSNMAIGVGKLLGFRIARNFNHPFLARNIAEYWRNWHISLTGWLTDYVFSPLNIALRNLGKLGVIYSVIITFVLIGLWHGANWTYGIFGLYHGLLYIPLILSDDFGKKVKIKTGSHGLPKTKDLFKMTRTYLLVTIGLIIFRSSSVSEVISFISSIIFSPIIPTFFPSKRVILFIIMLFVLEWIQRSKEHALQFSDNGITKSKMIRWCIYLLFLIIIFFFKGEQVSFIYFQF